MSCTGKLFWLASYPKSGNTWVRAFISNLLNHGKYPVDINSIDCGEIASSRTWVQTAFDFNIDELSHDEVDMLRPSAYEWLNSQARSFEYHKTHDAYCYVGKDKRYPLFPERSTAGVLLIVRNPLDVIVSYAHHLDLSVEKVIFNLNNNDYSICAGNKRLYTQLRQSIGDWSSFYRSWMVADVPLMMVRYEDLKANPIDTFTSIAHFLKLPVSSSIVSNAVENCKMENLQAQEQMYSFRERPPKASSFFRKGIVGDWKNELSALQVNRVIDAHYELMFELGYVDEKGHAAEF